MQTMQHIHVATSARPDRVIKTGVIQPYPIEAHPVRVARMTIKAFTQSVRPEGAIVRSEMQPEEIAMHAKRIADAMAQGVRMPPSTDQRLLMAAQYILQGKPFVIKSAGRAAIVKAATSPSSWEAIAQRNPAYYGMKHGR
jgi:hypothetical protein